MKIVTVIGARPQFLELKEYSQSLSSDQEQIIEVLVHRFLRSIPGSSVTVTPASTVALNRFILIGLLNIFH